MKKWIAKQLAKYFGPTFLSRNLSTLVGYLAMPLAALGTYLNLPPEAAEEFARHTQGIIQELGGLSAILAMYGGTALIDWIFSKKDAKKDEAPEQPEIIKE